jgi:glutathione synthase/RimK-type ligase-like ATP-grasp enzyme
MSAIDVALAGCLSLPEPDPDEAPLLEALRGRGLSAETWAWDDDTVDWGRARLVLLRATWNYYLDRPRFLAWAGSVAAVTALHNPVDVITWNTHKGYLLELAGAGVAVVPTLLLRRGEPHDAVARCRERGWEDLVIKPAVGAASYNAYVTRLADLDTARLDGEVSEGDMLVQPFVESVRTHGERSVVVIEGTVTHSVRKEPRFGGDDEQVTGPHPVADDEAALARAALAAVPHPGELLYARVDVVRDDRGAPMISELELAEPSLFFSFNDEALSRMAAAAERLLVSGGQR